LVIVLRPRELFVAFAQAGLRSFGGAIPWARRTLVEERRWMTDDEFADELGVGQLLPGANLVNVAARLGDRTAGWRGAVAALAGLVVVPTAVALVVQAILMQWIHLRAVHAALIAAGAAAAGLVWHVGIVVSQRSARLPRRALIAVGTFAAAGPGHLPLPWVLAVAVPLSLILEWIFR
jgi:chromate transporter